MLSNKIYMNDFLLHLCALGLTVGSVCVSAYVLARFRRLWYLIAIAITPVWALGLYKYEMQTWDKLQNALISNSPYSYYALVFLILLPAAYVIRERKTRKGVAQLQDDARMNYIYKSHEALTKETAALRTLITTMASGSLVAIRAINMVNPGTADYTRAMIFCLFSVACVLSSNVASLVSLDISMHRAADYSIQVKDLRECSSFIEYVLLFWSVVALIIGYYSFLICYVK